jgi:hypothetical protein
MMDTIDDDEVEFPVLRTKSHRQMRIPKWDVGRSPEDQIELNIPFNLEHDPSLPNNRNYFVQLVRLNDSNNIVDINFPEKP